jgi:hypothetical protein
MTLTRDYSCVPRGEEEVLRSIKIVDVVLMEKSFAICLTVADPIKKLLFSLSVLLHIEQKINNKMT